MSLSTLAQKYGTPLYVYSQQAIKQNFQVFDKVLAGQPHTICYSVKANPNLSILKLLAQLGSGFDVVSGGELERVLSLGRGFASRTVFSGVGKSTEEMDAALKAGILMFNVESESELRHLAARAKRSEKKARIAIRVNPNISAATHPYISTGLREHKFGVDIATAPKLYEIAATFENLEVVGVSVHIGSQITDMKPFTETLRSVARLMANLQRRGHPVKYVDAGGGLGINYLRDHSPSVKAQVGAYAKSLMAPLGGLGCHLLIEPGRAIIGAAGLLLTRVVYIKQNGGKKFVIVDAAMNDFIRPSHYGAYHSIVPVAMNPSRRKTQYDIVGPICETGDYFALDRQMAAAQEGEYLAILDAGAYGMSLSSNYNSRGRPAEVLVSGRSVRCIRRRESSADMLQLER